jgi:hypothetical protein
VVSSDAEVARHARLAGGKAVGVEGFLRELSARGPVTRTTSRKPNDEKSGGSTPGTDRHQREGRRPRSQDGAVEETKPTVKGKRDVDEWERLFREGGAPEEDD